jgi:hypothetical protein
VVRTLAYKGYTLEISCSGEFHEVFATQERRFSTVWIGKFEAFDHAVQAGKILIDSGYVADQFGLQVL